MTARYEGGAMRRSRALPVVEKDAQLCLGIPVQDPRLVAAATREQAEPPTALGGWR